MRFRRAQVRYSDTPEPVTPYQAAAQAWDDRIGSARVQAKNWRLMAFGCLFLAMLMAGGLVWRSAQSIAYDYATDRGAATLNDYARSNDPFASVGQRTIAVEVTSVVRASDNSFQVRWIERSFVNGAPAGTERWTAVLTIVLQPPRTEERLRKNPLGIHVIGLSWSRELDPSEGARKP